MRAEELPDKKTPAITHHFWLLSAKKPAIPMLSGSIKAKRDKAGSKLKRFLLSSGKILSKKPRKPKI